ncbi:GGDEF domain-containing protein [Romboutsia sp. 1001713B170131_170501_G6]|uniref:GGDEF domain-containing protein n=1 Tax=Romboutsia sp. 1001713B170131_170501_G6 TaxID=2787108 RepID=UPI0018AC6ED5|nr:GGDEF domain-containing protein [Romboutsia sp. 1001713B170131_170501_G6]
MNIYEYINERDILYNLFDCIRIVDPIKKVVIHQIKNKVEIERPPCYEFWNRNQVCENCISIRAYNEEKSFSKIEFNKERVYFVIATLIKINDAKYIIEALKDVTEDNILEEISKKSISDITKEVNRLNEIVVKDELTDCFNIRYVNEMLPFNISDSINENKTLSVCMLDLDYFKQINDTYGHLCGDFVLKEVGKILKDNIRKDIDWVARYGGEEFLVVFNNMPLKNVTKRVQAIKDKIEKHEFKWKDKIIKITSSFGISTLDEDTKTVESILESADKMLYLSKEKGRNNISHK